MSYKEVCPGFLKVLNASWSKQSKIFIPLGVWSATVGFTPLAGRSSGGLTLVGRGGFILAAFWRVFVGHGVCILISTQIFDWGRLYWWLWWIFPPSKGCTGRFFLCLSSTSLQCPRLIYTRCSFFSTPKYILIVGSHFDIFHAWMIWSDFWIGLWMCPLLARSMIFLPVCALLWPCILWPFQGIFPVMGIVIFVCNYILI